MANLAGVGGGVDRYMNRFLDFAVDVWQQQQNTADQNQQFLQDTLGHTQRQLDQVSTDMINTTSQLLDISGQNAKLTTEAASWREKMRQLETANAELKLELDCTKRKLQEQTTINQTLKMDMDRLESEKRALTEQVNQSNLIDEQHDARRKKPVKKVTPNRSIWTAPGLQPGQPQPGTSSQYQQPRSNRGSRDAPGLQPGQPQPQPCTSSQYQQPRSNRGSRDAPGSQPGQPQPGTSSQYQQPRSNRGSRDPENIDVDLTAGELLLCHCIVQPEPMQSGTSHADF